MQVQSTAAGKLQRGLAQAGRGYRCFVRGSLLRLCLRLLFRNVTLHIPATIALITTAATKISPTALVKYEEIRSKENEGEEVSLNVELQLRQSDYRKVIWKIIRTWNGDTPLARGVPFYARPTRVPRRGLFHP